jgi:chitinase
MKAIFLIFLFFGLSLSLSLKFLDEEKECSNDSFKITSNLEEINSSVAITNSAGYFKTNFTFKLQNTCLSAQSINKLIIHIEWIVNEKLVRSISDSITQNGSPWLAIRQITSDYYYSGLTLQVDSPECKEWCDWTKVKPGDTHLITLEYVSDSKIEISQIKSVIIGEKEKRPLSNLSIEVINSEEVYSLCKNNCQYDVILKNSIFGIVSSKTIDPLVNKITIFDVTNLSEDNYQLSVLPKASNEEGGFIFAFSPSENFSLANGIDSKVSITTSFKTNKFGSLLISLSFPSSDRSYDEFSINGKLSDLVSGKIYPLKLSSKDTSFKVDKISLSERYRIYLPKIVDPITGKIYDHGFNSELSIKENQFIKVSIIYKQISQDDLIIRLVNFMFLNYHGKLKLDYSSSEDIYLYISSNFEVSDGFSKTLCFLQGDVVGISSDQKSLTVSPNKIDSSVKKIRVEYTSNTSSKTIGGYYQSWSAKYSSNGLDHSLSQIPAYVTYILVSFATPNSNYKKGSFSWDGTGLNFCSDFNVVKEAIAWAKKNKPNQKFLLSVGGATYPWNAPNYQGIVDLIDDLGMDGVDIDYENQASCSGVDTADIKCSTDLDIISIIDNLKMKITPDKLVTAAVWSVGAYGSLNYPNSKFPPQAPNAGMWINPLRTSGMKLDHIFIMSYDASPVYSPIDAFDAYQSIFKGKIHIGLEVPPEAWGGNVLTVENSQKYADHVVNKNGEGIFIWSLQKSTQGVNSMTFLQPICKIFNLTGCDENIPLN